jgi:hypothetical protein
VLAGVPGGAAAAELKVLAGQQRYLDAARCERHWFLCKANNGTLGWVEESFSRGSPTATTLSLTSLRLECQQPEGHQPEYGIRAFMENLFGTVVPDSPGGNFRVPPEGGARRPGDIQSAKRISSSPRCWWRHVHREQRLHR